MAPQESEMDDLVYLAAQVAAELRRRKFQTERDGVDIDIMLGDVHILTATILEQDLEEDFDDLVDLIEDSVKKVYSLDGPEDEDEATDKKMDKNTAMELRDRFTRARSDVLKEKARNRDAERS